MQKQILMVLSLLWPVGTLAQNESVQAFEAWDLICPTANEGATAPACHLSQTVQSPSGRFNLMLATVVQRADSQVMILTTPLGVDLSAGLKWRVDARPERQFVFNTCTHDGCFVAVKLIPSLKAELRKGFLLRARYNDGVGNRVDAEVSLVGITAASTELEKRQQKRQ